MDDPGRTRVMIDGLVMITRRELLSLHFTRKDEHDTVQYARDAVAKLQHNEHDKPRMVLEIVHRKGAFTIGCDKDDEPR